MILTRADGKSMFMGYGWIVEAPLPDAPAQAGASVTYGGITRHVMQSLAEVMDKIIEHAHRESMTVLKPEPETYSEFVDRVVRQTDPANAAEQPDDNQHL
jgi:hypothetical protein